nr:RNA-directed DNA polymerase (reverse transcriptase) domain containing protein [Haemonchus contortus]
MGFRRNPILSNIPTPPQARTPRQGRTHGPPLYRALARRYTRYLAECTVPTAWKQSSTMLLFKKGDKEDVANYRPITLLPVLYKVFSRCTLARIRRTLEEAQSVEQAGFRRNFSTLVHIATCRRLIEASREHRLPLVMTFIDYKKALIRVEPVKVWEALEEQGVERIYVDVLRECYSHCTTLFHPFYNDVVVAVQKGVRQGDPISPNLFSACLEHVIRRCDWSNYGVNNDGVRLYHLRFADDIVLITETPEHASEMLHRLDEEGSHCGLTINTSKTKVMLNQFSGDTPVLLKGGAIEDVDEYVYFGSQFNMRNDLTGELARRRKAGWAAFNSIRSVLEDTRDCKLRADLFNSTVLPALSCAGETWALTKSIERHLMSTQASIERRLLGLTLSRQRELKLHNSDIRAMSKVKDVLVHVDEARHRFAGHLMRREDGRWSSAAIRWYSREK